MIKICLDDKLKETLFLNNIDVNSYIPAYNGESAGLDLYNSSNEDIKITSNSHPSKYEELKKVLIPTGLKVIIPKGYVGFVKERGSITKTPLKVRAGVIDCGYTGEIFVNCINTGKYTFTIKKNNKLPFQLVIVKCDNQFEVVNEEEYLNLSNNSQRREGSVGSSD